MSIDKNLESRLVRQDMAKEVEMPVPDVFLLLLGAGVVLSISGGEV